METADDALDAWEQRLLLAEEGLREREERALAGDPAPEVLLALAAERDKIALDHDSIAERREENALVRDQAALRRDVSASGRDRRARAADQDRDPAFLDRFAAGEERDLAAGDRADSYDDRRRARQARERAADDREHAAEDREKAIKQADKQASEIAGLRAALKSRLVIGQAQGLLMALHHLSADAAFQVLVRLSQERNVKLRDIAAGFVASKAGTPGDVGQHGG